MWQICIGINYVIPNFSYRRANFSISKFSKLSKKIGILENYKIIKNRVYIDKITRIELRMWQIRNNYFISNFSYKSTNFSTFFDIFQILDNFDLSYHEIFSPRVRNKFRRFSASRIDSRNFLAFPVIASHRKFSGRGRGEIKFSLRFVRAPKGMKASFRRIRIARKSISVSALFDPSPRSRPNWARRNYRYET